MRSFLASWFELPDYAGRILPFEGLRGFAALIVFFVHFRALFGDRIETGSFLHWATSIAGAFGHTGVDIFFVLSGYLIYGIVMRDRFRYFPYLLRRFRRLYPTFLAVFAAYLVLSAVFPEQSKLPGLATEKLTYILANMAMLPGIFPIAPIIAPAWSLSYELVFYLVLPVVIVGLGIRRWVWWHRIVFFLFLAAIHTTLCAAGMANHVRFIMFAAGIVLWEVGKNYSPAGKLNAWGECAAIVFFCANLAIIGITYAKNGPMTVVLTRVPQFYSLSLFVTIFFLVLHAVFFDGVLSRLLSWDYLRWVGNMSYSYYLIHGLALHGVQKLVDSRFIALPHTVFYFVALFGFCVMASLSCAAALYLWVEKPLSLQPRAAKSTIARGPIGARDAN